MFRILSCLILTFFILCAEGQSFFIEPDQTLNAKDNRIIDFRPTSEFKKQHIKNSINLNFEEMWFIFSTNPQEFYIYLSSLGVTPDNKVILAGCDGKSEELLNCLSFAYLLYYGNFSNVSLLKGTLPDWQKKRVTLVSLGDEVIPRLWNFKLNEEIFYAKNKKFNAKKKRNEVILSLDENLKGGKKSPPIVYVDMRDFLISKGGLLDDEVLKEYFKMLQLKRENVLIIYPYSKKESFALAYLLKIYLKYENVFILKGAL